MRTIGGAQISGYDEKFQISSMSAANREIIAEFDDLANSLATSWCKDAVHQLVVKQKEEQGSPHNGGLVTPPR